MLKKYKIIIAGKNWDFFNQKNIEHITIKGELEPKQVRKIFNQSKITISSNCHGLGLHSRILEAAMEKSLIFMNTSAPNIEGNMANKFIPDIHFVEYNEHNLNEKLEFWLSNDSAREIITENMYKLITQKHTWSSRAQEIANLINEMS